MKKSILLLAFAMIILVSCSKNNHPQNNLPNYSKFNELPAEYTLDEAKADGCVVFDDLTLTSGEDVWNNFLELTQSGQAAKIRFANHYSEEGSSLFIIDLSFDGKIYSAIEKDGVTKQYKYLNHYTREVEANSLTLDYYILVNEKKVTFDELEISMTSSSSNAYIEQRRIFINKIQ